jgi:hypothetical protein
MRVVFKCSNPELFDYIIKAFKLAEMNDNWHLASLRIGESKAEYITCCRNRWFVEKVEDGVLFGYEGTRSGAIRLQPFRNLQWHSYDPPILEYILEWQTYSIVDENGNEHSTYMVPLKVKTFELNVIEYETTTPKRWQLKWYHQVEKIPERNMAVIMSPRYPLKIVRYRNVYLEKALEKFSSIS